MKTFKESTSTFAVIWELVPGRGAKEEAQENLLEEAERAAQSNKINAIAITDNPGGNPAMSADYLGQEILNLGIEPLVHFTCKDKNRNQIESMLYSQDRANIKNLLVMSGDYPSGGFGGKAKPVFDLDPTHILSLISLMNDGLEVEISSKKKIQHKPSQFFPGAVASPFKATEAEQMTQYYKLKKKIASGAEFIITQVGYDIRKFHEILQFMKIMGYKQPLIMNIYVLPYGVGRLMNDNQFPGCVVTDKLLGELEGERIHSDKGVKARLIRAAKMYALAKGLGFNGVHIGGHNVNFDQVEFIIEKGEELTSEWENLVKEFDYSIPNGFYYFQKDKETGLNTNIPVNRSKSTDSKKTIDVNYKFMDTVHDLVFEPDKPLYSISESIAKKINGTKLEEPMHKTERLIKQITNNCNDCGDCALPNLAYYCPMSCPKNQRNGPCGGSHNGWCEVYPETKKCIWVKAFNRLKNYDLEHQLGDFHLPPYDWSLYQTSSWINFFLKKSHQYRSIF